jgi:RimJ/RimL family protein N-acetyltransferase
MLRGMPTDTPSFGPIPADLVSFVDGDVSVRLAAPDDAGVLFALLSDPAIPNLPDAHRPSSVAELEESLAAQQNFTQTAFDRGVIAWVIELDGKVVGTLSTELDYEMQYSARPCGPDVPTVEYSVYRNPHAKGHGVGRRAIALVEPVLVRELGIEQAVATVLPINEEALRAIRSSGEYFGPLLDTPSGEIYAKDMADNWNKFA